MSNIYIQEPPTNGKVLLNTTVGDIDIELWSKEAPKACRNFVQLCLEGYYDGTIFHRVVKGFIVQGGDPTGAGTGGESIYGQPFKVTGNTLYNVLKFEDCLVDHEDRPIYPHKIISCKVLSNPFPDIVPRTKVTEEKPISEKPKEKIKKNFKLLSFGEEAEEDEAEVDAVNEAYKGQSKSSHDLANDPKLSSIPAVDVDKGDADTEVLDNIRKKFEKERDSKKEESVRKIVVRENTEDKQPEDNEEERKRKEVQKQIKELTKELKKSKKEAVAMKEESQKDEGIDEESFALLDAATIGHLIPKSGPRLKFKKYFKSYLATIDSIENVSISSISDSYHNSSICSSETSIAAENSKTMVTVSHTDTDIAECGSPSLGNASDPFSSSSPSYSLTLTPIFVDTFSKPLDINGVVKKKLSDIYKKLVEGDPSQINILEKYKINRALVEAHIAQYDCRPTTKDKLELAKHIVKVFPVLKGADGEGFEQWFCPGVKGAPATGFIAERFRNVRLRNFSPYEKEELGIKRIKREALKKVKLIGSEDTSVEFLQKQQWLKENSCPTEQVLRFMSETS